MSKPYLTPGVYVTEVSTLPPSIVQVATAIPAFIGYVEKALDDNGNPVKVGIESKDAQGVSNGKSIVTRRIGSMLEYQQYFGVGAPQSGTVTKGSTGLTFTADTQPFSCTTRCSTSTPTAAAWLTSWRWATTPLRHPQMPSSKVSTRQNNWTR